MSFAWPFEIGVNLALQALGTWLVPLMKLFSFLGQEEFYLILMPFVYWCINPVVGMRMGLILMASNGINHAFKIIFHGARPYYLNPEVKALSTEVSFGFPSGHAQNAASMWGMLAANLKDRWQVWASIAVAFFIGVSRLYLGVHFLTDVLAGWLIGGLLLWAFVRFEMPVINWIKKMSLLQMLLMAFISSLVVLVLPLIARLMLGDWQVPEIWAINAAAAGAEEMPDPLAISGAFTVAGTWFGLAAGAAWLYRKQGRFVVPLTLVKKLIAYGVGLIGVMLFWYGLGAIFPRTPELSSYLLRYLRYALVGGWMSAAAPFLFIKMKLME